MSAPRALLTQGAEAGLARAEEHLAALTRAYSRALRAAGRRAAARMREAEPVLAAADPAGPPGWVPPPTGSLIDSGELAADTERKTAEPHRLILGASASSALEPFGLSFDIHAPAAEAVLAQFAQRIQETIAAAIAEQVSEATRDGYENGDSVATVSKAIQARVDEIAPARADMLARSDLNGLANSGSLLAATISGAAATKTWLATEDEKTRETHAEADGQTVPINEPFDVGGEAAQYPGDPNLSWEESANCFPGGTRVGGHVATAMRSPYRGNLIEIQTHSGRILAGTPNHPILTRRGWIPLQFIEEGDQVVCARLDERPVSSAADVNDVPPTLDEVWDSLSVTGELERIAARDVNFHGDRPDGEVEVVRADGLLELRGTPAFLKPAQEFALSIADGPETLLSQEGAGTEFIPRNLGTATSLLGMNGEGGAFLRRHTGHTDAVSLADRAPSYAFVGQTAFDDGAGGAERLGNLLLGHPAVVKPDDFGDVNGDAVGPARIDLAALQVIADCLSRDLELVGDLLVGESGGIELDDVVSVETLPSWHGDVLTLETGTGYYTANGLIAKNCRCTVIYGEPLTASAAGNGYRNEEPLGAMLPVRLEVPRQPRPITKVAVAAPDVQVHNRVDVPPPDMAPLARVLSDIGPLVAAATDGQRAELARALEAVLALAARDFPVPAVTVAAAEVAAPDLSALAAAVADLGPALAALRGLLERAVAVLENPPARSLVAEYNNIGDITRLRIESE